MINVSIYNHLHTISNKNIYIYSIIIIIPPKMAATLSTNVHVHDLPDVILSYIFSLISNTRTRNAMSLVCLKWHLLERSTRLSIILRGNIRDLFLLPTCFRAVTDLDLSLLSPWGYPLLGSSHNPFLLAQLLRRAFPCVTSLTVYARNPLTLHLLAPQWPNLHHVKLIRWHQRSSVPLGSDIIPLFEHCPSLSTLDLSHFYCWTEDILPALEAHPSVAASLSRLDILAISLSEGFKSQELLAITAACPNLRELLAVCMFDHRYIDFVGGETLLALASNCPRLSLLHLADTSSLSNDRRGESNNDERYMSSDATARISHATLADLFASLPLLEELVLDVCQNLRDTGAALELLNSKCPRLKSLKLGQFQGICQGIDQSSLNGIALCKRLESLSIKNAADLNDSCLIAIAIGCPRMAKFEVEGCKMITEVGMKKMACILRHTLIDVKISSCKQLNAVSSLRALEPIRGLIQRLHIDCTWENIQQSEGAAASILSELPEFIDLKTEKRSKKLKYNVDVDSSDIPRSNGNRNGNGFSSSRTWAKLQYLSLWIAVGELLSPLAFAGLENCPVLEEIQIKVKGDCRWQSIPSKRAFGLSSLARYPQLSKMHLDCGDVIGYALTAPCGHMDLSLWERFYVNGIGNLNLTELNYWPPQDRDVNQRSLSLPAAGLLAQCVTLRKLFIHGTANEHFMMFLLRIPSLRDVQLREDYYPAPENDTSTEMRVDSCCRFEDALNRRWIPD